MNSQRIFALSDLNSPSQEGAEIGNLVCLSCDELRFSLEQPSDHITEPPAPRTGVPVPIGTNDI